MQHNNTEDIGLEWIMATVQKETGRSSQGERPNLSICHNEFSADNGQYINGRFDSPPAMRLWWLPGIKELLSAGLYMWPVHDVV